MSVNNLQKEFIVGKTKIGGSNPCFIIAEIGINFNGDYQKAMELIDSAKNAKCSAVKFQLFSAKKMYIPGAGEDKSGAGRKKDIYKIVQENELPIKWIPRLKEYANELGLEFFSTVCDEDGVDILEKFGVDAFKIASYEITHLPLLRHVARTNKPIIFSCGASEMEEISQAMAVLREEKNEKIALLHCIAKYGVDLSSVNLNIIKTLRMQFPEAIIGYSDHSADPIAAPVGAVALGAKIIEKHITLNKAMPGPDHFFALEPKELAMMVSAIREAERKIKNKEDINIAPELLGDYKRKTFEEENIPRNFTHRRIFAIKAIKRGGILSNENIAVLRPGNIKGGLEAKYYQEITGCAAKKDIPIYKGITWSDVSAKEDVKISVIVRTYNSESTVREALDSVIEQSIDRKKYEILVVDDGSTDNTLNILEEYGNRIRVVKQKHTGPVGATNRGIAESKGVFITLLDSDDVFLKNTLKKMEQGFLSKFVDYVYCDYFERFGKRGKKVVSLKENIFKTIGCGIMFRKELFNRVGLFDKKFIFAEYDFLVRLIRNKIQGKYISSPLYIYRRNEKSLTFNKEFVREGLKQLRKVHGSMVDKIREY